jgi:hypothetical protein
MATTIEQNDPTSVTDTTAERGVHVPSLPLELWHLIFQQNTDPQHLWINGRQVCSTWRAEIPKVIAKKYLEDREMTNIAFSAYCGGGGACLDRDYAFSHYNGKNTMVFGPLAARNKHQYQHLGSCNRYIALMKEVPSRPREFRSGIYPSCRECIDKPGGKRCDIPEYFIRIKRDAFDTELAGLQAYFNEEREISVEWEAMLEAFFREAAVISKRNDEIAREAIQWFQEGKRSIASVVLRALHDRQALWRYRKEVRRDRVRRWHLHDYTAETGRNFDRADWDDFVEVVDRGLKTLHRLAEDNEEEQMWDIQSGYEEALWEVQRSSRREKKAREPSFEGSLDIVEDEQLVSSVWRREFPRNETPEERGAYGKNCIVQWLGRGRIRFDPTTIV